MNGYECPKDYYDNYLFGRSPSDVARKRADEMRESRASEERTRQEMKDYHDRFGD